MIRSMTGFGSAAMDNENYKIAVELKSINHRYSDIHLKLPKELSKFEMEARQILKSLIIRGKLEVTVQFRNNDVNTDLSIDENLLDTYVKLLNHISDSYGVNQVDDAIKLLNLPNVLINDEVIFEDEILKQDFLRCINEAFLNLDKARIIEGENLKIDILGKLDLIEDIVKYIESICDKFILSYRDKLRKNLEELLVDKNVSEDRIIIEAGILADKLCIDEEIVRLNSHIYQTKDIINNSEKEVGRKLDFILQEFNREANTILSKSSDIDIVNKGLELKYIIEKIREQVQNLI